jgi:alpha-galactosidase
MKRIIWVISLISVTLTSIGMGALPAPWTGQDIGSVGIPGSSSESNGVFTVSGSGADIWGTVDAFHYVHQAYTGDVQIITKVTSQTYTDGWAKAGVMIRETLDNNSKHAMMIISLNHGSSFQHRSLTGGSSGDVTPGDGLTVPCWLRLVRTGNKFKGYTSVNGTDWTQIGTVTISMTPAVRIGLCVTAHNNSKISTAKFENVSINTDTTPPSPNPATWSEEPNATGSDTVVMTAATGTDESGPVEYYFEETSGNPGGYDSGWLRNHTYTNRGLKPVTTYTYVVRMRDAFENTSGNSQPPVSVTTNPSPDMDDSGFVDMSDIANLVEHWLDANCLNNLWCGGSDLNMSGDVSFPDFALLAQVWLQPYGGTGPFYDWARTPPMGWNSWNKFGCSVNEWLVRDIADAMVSSGMKDAGYIYVNIDDCWHGTRDANGYIQPNPATFPSGMAALADYVHSLGLKLGIYSDAGTLTCAGYPGSKGYEQKDANQYAAWGIDYLKYDWCNTAGQDKQQSYTLMRDCLLNTGRPIVYSICSWSFPGEWVVGVGNLWRTTGDIGNYWGSVVSIIDLNAYLYPYAGPGHWNDPDMLEVGNGGMTDTEYRSHFSMWCIMAAPLLAGNDLRSMSPATINILTAPEVIAVDQDPLGIQGRRIYAYGNTEVWVKELVDDSRAVALFNRGSTAANITVYFSDLGPEFTGNVLVRDLWARLDLGIMTTSYTANVPSHGVVLIKASVPVP